MDMMFPPHAQASQGTIRPFPIVPMSLATNFVSFVSRCTGDGLDHIGPRFGEAKVFMCLHVPSIPARTCAGESVRGAAQRTGLMSAMIIGAIEVRAARESEKAMSWAEVTVKAVNNSDEVAFCSSSSAS